MKIISKHKDYFDYLVGYYGYDDHIVWDRRNTKPLNLKKWQNRFLFHICGDIYPVIRKGRDYILSPDDNRLSNDPKYNYDKCWMQKWSGEKSDINSKLRQPVLCLESEYDENYFIPCLSEFGFATIIDANEMYQRIYAFLGWLKDNPEIPNNQTDKEKVFAHGFDNKTSFRPKIKA